ncbi:MAG: hypothetical protein F4179_12060, partial [Gammaproteobacteria bacterium]|nr:hypothetical protein [Gammaproteobacteria bacterium]
MPSPPTSENIAPDGGSPSISVAVEAPHDSGGSARNLRPTAIPLRPACSVVEAVSHQFVVCAGAYAYRSCRRALRRPSIAVAAPLLEPLSASSLVSPARAQRTSIHRLPAMVTHSRLLLLCVAALWACGDGDAEPTAPPDPPRPTTVTVSPATAELGGVGATVQLSAQVLDQNRQAMASARLTWSSSDATVATVSASGLVTAADRGAAIITATVGDASGTSEIQVVESPDREPLVAFYEALDGAYWFDDENWLTDAPLGEWRGVDTEFGRVVRLDLEGNGLWGPIPSELGNLTSLEGLFLSDNDLWDPIPPELGNLGSLEW